MARPPKASKSPLERRAASATEDGTVPQLLDEICQLIEAARLKTAQSVNTGLALLYWSIGNRIRTAVLQERRAEYGKEIVSTLSRQLTAEYGRGFSQKSLFHMIRMAEAFPDLDTVGHLAAKATLANGRQHPIQRCLLQLRGAEGFVPSPGASATSPTAAPPPC